MKCYSCVNKVEKKLQTVIGVKNVSVNLAFKKAKITHDQFKKGVIKII